MDSNPAFSMKSFFKVLKLEFHQKLKLPPAVSKEFEKWESQTVILESRIGRWKIGVCKNDLICFQRGWPEFVSAHSLDYGDFLVFRPTKHLHFNVSVFDAMECEKVFPDETNKAIQALNLTAEDENSYFVMKIMQPRHATKRARMNIPRAFIRANKLGEEKKARLRDPKGREWTVRLVGGGKHGLRQRLTGEGWRHFCTSNALDHGHHTCVFKLIRPISISNSTIFFHVHFLPA